MWRVPGRAKTNCPKLLQPFINVVVPLIFGLFAASAQARTGKVVDADGQPLAGVYVIASWTAEVFQGVTSSHTCFRLDAARTNERGDYSISSWSWDLHPTLYDRALTLRFYRQGYRSTSEIDFETNPHSMVKDERSRAMRIAYLASLASATHCGDGQDQKATALPILRALYDEAGSAVGERTSVDLKYLNNLQFEIERLEMGNERAREKYRERDRDAVAVARAEALRGKPDAEIGMTARQVREETRWGAPHNIKLGKTTPYGPTHEIWEYGGGRFLYLEQGKVVDIKTD